MWWISKHNFCVVGGIASREKRTHTTLHARHLPSGCLVVVVAVAALVLSSCVVFPFIYFILFQTKISWRFFFIEKWMTTELCAYEVNGCHNLLSGKVKTNWHNFYLGMLEELFCYVFLKIKKFANVETRYLTQSFWSISQCGVYV